MRHLLRCRPIWIALAAVTLATACGENDGTHKGGTLKVLAAGDVDSIDPGIAYYQFSYMVHYATQRPLYSWAPNETKSPTPDLAEDEPRVSDDGRTVSIKIREGVNYSPPVNREVTAKDVKYALERGITNNISNPYVGTYFSSLEGFGSFEKGKAKEVSGIQTPDDRTIVFKLARPTGVIASAEALSLPLSAPVPREYAERFDQRAVSNYGQHQVATGPYMIQNDRSGKLTGYEPGKRILLVRNPNWDEGTDYRDANLDRIEIDEGNDPPVASRQILNGSNAVSGDFLPPAAVLKTASASRSEQIASTPSGGNRYVALNTTIPPFDDVNVRRAVVAAADRDALRLTIGGAKVGDVATHFIPPGVPGFEQAGGYESKLDFLRDPQGDMALSSSYMKMAGYESGKYEGDERLLAVGASEDPDRKTAEVTQTLFEGLGFKLDLRLVSAETMYTKFCGTPKAKVAICPNVGLAKDFNDAQSMLVPGFSGRSILPVNNSNWPQLDDPKVNAAMEQAEALTEPDARAKAWGRIDLMVTALAPAIPWTWDRQVSIRSSNVAGVINRFNATWDLSFTSLE